MVSRWGLAWRVGAPSHVWAGKGAKLGEEEGGGREPADAANPETEPEEMIELEDGNGLDDMRWWTFCVVGAGV